MNTVNMEKFDLVELNKRLLKRWLNPDDVEIDYGLSKSTQAKLRSSKCSSKKIPFSKVGSKIIRYDRFLLDAWLEEHQVQGA